MVVEWKDRLKEIEDSAVERLRELEAEAVSIYSLFPHLAPRVKGTGIKKLYHGRHWTQRPENRERVQAAARRMQAARGR